MRSNRPTLTAALLVACLAAPASRAAEPESPAACDAARARSVAEGVQRRYDAIRELTADFVQTTESVVLSGGGGGGAEESRGRVTFSKPGRMRWAYLEPEPSFVISDGSVLWIYQVGSDQATRVRDADQYLAGAALQFLIGEGDLDASFVITPRACEPGRVALDLRPRRPASYERLGLTADVESGMIVETSIVDLFGNRTRIVFDHVVVGQSPPEGAFEFEVPEGVEVIDVGGPS